MVIPPNHTFQIGFSTINHPFWGTTILGNPHITANVSNMTGLLQQIEEFAKPWDFG